MQRVAGGASEDKDHDRQNRQCYQRLEETKEDEAKHGLLKVGGEPSSPPTPPSAYFRASSSMNRSYITAPGLYLPSVLEVAYGECT